MVKFNDAVSALMFVKNDISKVDVDSSKTKLFNAAVLSKNISTRLESFTYFFLGHCKVMNDSHATKLEKKKLTTTIIKTIVPLISIAAEHLNYSSSIISHIPSSPSAIKTEPHPKRVSLPHQIPSRILNIPQPSNGSSYFKTEVVSIISPYNSPKRSTIRSTLIDKMVKSSSVKGGMNTIYRALKNARNRKSVKHSNFISCGKPPLLTNDDVTSMCEKFDDTNGRAYGSKEIKKMMISQVKESVSKCGNVPLADVIDPCRTTISNYTALFSQSSGIFIDGSKAISKTNTRYTAENSLIVSALYAVAVASSHFILIKEEDARTRRDIANASVGIRMMYKLTS